MSPSRRLAASFSDAADALERFRTDEGVVAALSALAERLAKTLAGGGKALVAGNGGSMADAIHFAEEWTGRFRADRRPYPAIALGADPAHLTCVGNDYGFEEVFSRPVRAFAAPGDVLILLSTSGNSENLLRAAAAGRERGAFVFGFLGRGGGRLAPRCDAWVDAPGATSDRIQELHMLSLHVLIEIAEGLLGETA